MAIYLKKFETQAAYEAAESGLILPNVSLTLDNNTVHYKPSTPTPSHDYVEIGGVKWATMNVGANSITDTGLYFQWADTQGYTAAQVGSGEGLKYFGEDDYIYYDDGSYTKYNEGDSKTVLDASDDAVKAAWGGNWRMPTDSEFAALYDTVNTAWTTDYQGSGVSGMVCTDKTDSSKVLFFPAAGNAYKGSVMNTGKNCDYWSSSLYNSSIKFSLQMYAGNGYVYWRNTLNRYAGNSIRPVLDE